MKTEQLTYKGGKILIGIIEENMEKLIPQLDNFDAYKDEFSLLTNEKRKKEFLAVRILANIITDSHVVIHYDEHRKPFLQDYSYHISITHSKNYAAIMIHPDHPVGIDLEERTERVKNIYERFLNDNEQWFIKREDNTNKMEIAWSAKETLFKIIGNNARNFAETLEILPFSLNASGTLYVLHIPFARIYELQYIQNANYTLVWGIDKKIKL